MIWRVILIIFLSSVAFAQPSLFIQVVPGNATGYKPIIDRQVHGEIPVEGTSIRWPLEDFSPGFHSVQFRFMVGASNGPMSAKTCIFVKEKWFPSGMYGGVAAGCMAFESSDAAYVKLYTIVECGEEVRLTAE